MKVAVIRNSYGPSNAQMMRVAVALQELGHDLVFVTRQHDKLLNDEYKNKVCDRPLEINGTFYPNYEIQVPAARGAGIKNILPTSEFLMILSNILHQLSSEIDAIHAIDFDTGFIAQKVAKKYGLKFVYHIADFYADSRLGLPKFASDYLRDQEYKVINRADATIICTEKRRTQIQGSHPKSLSIVHNTPPLNQLPSDYPEKDVHLPIRISYIGSVNQERFIPQAAQVISKMPEYEFHLAGFIDKDYKSFIEKINHYQNIKILDSLPYEKVFDQYRQSDIMFAMYDPRHPNHKYSAPNKIYEAMLLALPIIVAKNSGMDDIVANEDMGFVIPYDMVAFSEILKHIAEHPEILYPKAVNAFNAYEKYSWKKMKKRIQDIYLTLC